MKVYDVVWNDMDKRPRTARGLTPVGDTVDRKTATYTNTIGAPELRTTWRDPDYVKGQSAFHYVRVFEIRRRAGRCAMRCALALN